MTRDRITLYLTEARAFEAAEIAMEHFNRIWKMSRDAAGTTFRVLSATMRDKDGSVDKGFKVLIVPPHFIGDHPFYL